ncbi:Protein shisa-9 [Acipenser ruthenus]|uniref:Protein shisa-9 n=1 Tax=Acipenser ruthenus TaxID=7906 RepID=A0A444UPS0_ACIRT|nr:Protein shisa-9 [Acipenser ruthenus]
MNRIGLLLCYFLVEFMTLVCKAQGKSGHNLGSIVVVSGSNGSKDGANSVSDPPPSADMCRGYFDVMGQWDHPFNCSAGTYLYCCGTCGFRFCCQLRQSRLDQSTCTNYDTPVWLMTGRPPSKKDDPTHDPTKDKTNLIVYIICGVVAIMVLARQRATALMELRRRDLIVIELHSNMQLSKSHLLKWMSDTSQMNNVGPNMSHPHSYPALSQLTNPYEQQPPAKELNKYASLKAVAEQANNDFYSKRRHLAELAAKGSLPLHPMRMEHEESNPYNPDLTAIKQNGHKNKISKTHTHPLAFSSNTMKGWDPNDTSSRRHTYSNKKHCTVEQVNELQSSRSQHFLPPPPYFVTNSKTERHK